MKFVLALLVSLVIASSASVAAAQQMAALPGPARVMQPNPSAASTAPNASAPLPLSSPDRDARLRAPGAAAGRGGSLTSTLTMFVMLGVVLGLFLLVAWAIKRGLPTGSRVLPREVVEVLGRAPLGGRQFAHLLRCGNKLVLVSLTPGGADTITEVTDPLEVDRLAGLCQSASAESTTQSFRQVFQKLGGERLSGGFFGVSKGGEPAVAEDADA